MEPAAGRRDDRIVLILVARQNGPQWSPPLVGGMTALPGGSWAEVTAPQWSPPLVGGMTTPTLVAKVTG